MSNIQEFTCGSNWKRWDLHLHAPGTKLSNNYGDPTDDNFEKYVKKLENSDVMAFGITDYFSFDGYLNTKEAYDKHFPNGKKVFFPNIEFRLVETVSTDGRNVHTHAILDPNKATKENLNDFLSNLKTHSGKTCLRFSSSDYSKETVDINKLESVLKEIFGENNYIIVTAANNDGLRGVDTNSERSKSLSDLLDKQSHAFFGSSQNTKHFLSRNRYEGNEESFSKPVLSGSDAHSFDDLERLDGFDSNFKPTWIKADLTFQGLRQTLFEPEERVFIGKEPEVLKRVRQDATRFISNLNIDQEQKYSDTNGIWFKGINISFNPELTTIIGNKGSGKSAVADIIGLLGDSRQKTHFSFLSNNKHNRKFCQKGYAENFFGKLVWANGNEKSKNLSEDITESNPESVKYLPQNCFEGLTNEIEVNDFRKKIEEVVYSHVDETDRMGTGTFSELEQLKTSQSKSKISNLKSQLRELNFEIRELEHKASTKEKLTIKLEQMNEMYDSLELAKPEIVNIPDQSENEQNETTEKIKKLTELQSNIADKGKNAVDRLTQLKKDNDDLQFLIKSVDNIEEFISEKKRPLKEVCEKFKLDIDLIIDVNFNKNYIENQIEAIKLLIHPLEDRKVEDFTKVSDLLSLDSIADLREAYKFISNEINEKQEKLSAPERKYQQYLQSISEIETKKSELMGDSENPRPETINFVNKQIFYIEKKLDEELEEKKHQRRQIAKSIFETKAEVRTFYETLQLSIESSLETINRDEISVSIDATFVLSNEFQTEFFNFISRNVKGYFHGIKESTETLQSLILDVEWNDFQSLISFVEKILDEINQEDVDKQVKDLKLLYDFLYSLDYINASYELRLGNKNLNQLSPGEKGLLLLVFYLQLDKEKTPLIIDQPEDNLDNDSIYKILSKCIRRAKKTRQIVLVTHNPNLAIGADAEQVLFVNIDKVNDNKFSFQSGSIENPVTNNNVLKILEGSRPAFVQRRLKYRIE